MIGRTHHYHHLVKPLDNNVISHLGRLTTKTIAFSLELPYENKTSIEYTSFIQLFLSNDHRHSIVDHPVIIKSPQPITVEFISLSTRSVRVSMHHLCLSYIEVKVTVYQNSVRRDYRYHRLFDFHGFLLGNYLSWSM